MEIESLSKAIWDQCGMHESGPDKIDVSLLKCGSTIEVQQARDVAGGIEFLTGELSLADFKKGLVEEQQSVIGQMLVLLGADDKCPEFIRFLKQQAKRLKFRLVVFESPRTASEMRGEFARQLKERGALRV